MMKLIYLIPFMLLFFNTKEVIVLKDPSIVVIKDFYAQNPSLASKSMDDFKGVLNSALIKAESSMILSQENIHPISFLLDNPNKDNLSFYDDQNKLLFESNNLKIHTPPFIIKKLKIESSDDLNTISFIKVYVDYSIEVFELLEVGFGTSIPCMENINCYPNIEEQQYKNSVVRVVFALEEGTGYCTGTMMNNTNEDDTPYVLTSFHVDVGYTPIYEFWRFDFDYEASGCLNPDSEPLLKSVTGCDLKAKRFESDFQLLEITNPVPYEFDVYFMGWDKREATIPNSSSILHHPSGDIMKYSRDDDPSIIYGLTLDWGALLGVTPAHHHFRSYLDLNKFEPGSSGCAMLDENYRVLGQLHGGNVGCVNNAGSYYGRFYFSWFEGGTATTQLSDWLDPENVGLEYMDGKEMSIPTATISGIVLDVNGNPVPNTIITISGQTQLTDSNGQFSFVDMIANDNYIITPYKNSDASSGLDEADINIIRGHILEINLITDPVKLIAADVNLNGSITGADAVITRQVFLNNTINEFPNVASWVYIDSGNNLISDISVTLPLEGVYIEFSAIKMGDLD